MFAPRIAFEVTEVTASPQPVEPFDLVIFGGTGDLAIRKLLPALYHRFVDGQIPASSRIIGIAREGLDDDGYRTSLRKALQEGGGNAAKIEAFLGQVGYRSLDARKDEGWDAFAALIREQPGHIRVFYLSTTPELFVAICDRLGSYGLNRAAPAWCWKSRSAATWPRRAARSTTPSAQVFAEQQIFRIDHYLGKETVQNLMALRFANVAVRAAVERRAHRPRADHRGRDARRRRPRRLLRRAPARCATWCRTTCCSCSAWSPWSRRPRSTPMRCATKS